MRKSSSIFQALRNPQTALLMTVFLDLLGFGLVIPFIQLYGESLGARGLMLGFLLSSYSLMQFVFAPLWGRLADGTGRRPVILYSVAGSAISFGLFAFSESLPMLFLSRIVGGIMAGNLSAAQAYMADITPMDQRSKAMGLLGAALGAGFILGPPIGGMLSGLSVTSSDPLIAAQQALQGGHRWVGLLGVVLSLINLALIYFYLPESLKPENRLQKADQKGFALSTLMQALQTPILGTLLILFFVANFGMSNLEATFFRLMERLFGYHEPRVPSLVLGFVGIVSVFSQTFVLRRISNRFEERTLIRIGYALQAPGLLLLPFAPNLAAVFLFSGLLSLGGGIVYPTINSLVSKASPPNMRGSIFGVLQGLGSLARVVGPSWGNALFEKNYHYPYLFAAAMVIVALLLSLSVKMPAYESLSPEATGG